MYVHGITGTKQRSFFPSFDDKFILLFLWHNYWCHSGREMTGLNTVLGKLHHFEWTCITICVLCILNFTFHFKGHNFWVLSQWVVSFTCVVPPISFNLQFVNHQLSMWHTIWILCGIDSLVIFNLNLSLCKMGINKKPYNWSFSKIAKEETLMKLDLGNIQVNNKATTISMTDYWNVFWTFL